MGEGEANSGRELIVILQTGNPSNEATTAGLGQESVSSLQELAVQNGLQFLPVFHSPDELDTAQVHLADQRADVTSGPQAPWQDEFFQVAFTGPVPLKDQELDEWAARLSALPGVVSAYVKPPTFAAALPPKPGAVIGTGGSGGGGGGGSPAPWPTPDFSAQQGYLDPAPGGLDARYAWTFRGGRGGGIRIIDIEGDWQLTHESLQAQKIQLRYGLANPAWRNHGTAVLGEIAGTDDRVGVLGISHDSTVGVVSIFNRTPETSGTARAIEEAAGKLSAGDILLIELHRPGKRYGFKQMPGQEGYIPVEWWPDDFEAVRRAVNSGIIVVSAAGNGGEDLDDPMYDTPVTSFGSNWMNPFGRGAGDSGSILVGAGAPPTNPAQVPDRSRLSFSNYGSCVDAQGWGGEVVTCGYGDLQSDPNEDRRYTAKFNGTSSAAPMIVGTLACLQDIRLAAGKSLLTPHQARSLLHDNGSLQQDAPKRPATQRIGRRPDLKELINAMAAIP